MNKQCMCVCVVACARVHYSRLDRIVVVDLMESLDTEPQISLYAYARVRLWANNVIRISYVVWLEYYIFNKPCSHEWLLSVQAYPFYPSNWHLTSRNPWSENKISAYYLHRVEEEAVSEHQQPTMYAFSDALITINCSNDDDDSQF